MGKGDPREGVPGRGETFGGMLRGLREAAGLTQEELAWRAGLSPNAVGVLERGRRKRPYPHTVRALADALGLDEDARAALLASVPRRGAGGAMPPAADAEPSPARSSLLPNPATPLVGREREVAEVVDLLGEPQVRSLTLTGVGGVGKTRLAVEAARASLTSAVSSDGAAFVGLASVGDPALVLPTIARVLGLRETSHASPLDALMEHLRDRRLLLVLDNLEHLLEAAPGLASLVEGCLGLTVLTTSRAPLRIRGEREYPVPPLALPPTTRSPTEDQVIAAPSGRLFLERARAVSPGFEVTEGNAAAVAQVCRRLAGIPLALELAAARVRFMEPAALLSRLDRALSTAWARDLPERQRTMRATLDWSHGLLERPERTLFRRLSVFAGGFTLEAAEDVGAASDLAAEEIAELLGRLVEQSLVEARPDAGGGTTRYGMLEPVRQYAAEKLEEGGEAAPTRRRHALYFLAMAEAARPGLLGAGHASWLGRLEQEHDNLREALRWARELGEAEIGLRLVGSLYWFWWLHGHLGEGRRWVEVFLSGCGGQASDLARAMALYGAGELALGQGDLARSVALLEESLALLRGLRDEAGVAIVLAELGQAVRAWGEHDRAASLSEEALALGRRLGRRDAIAVALNTLGHIERQRGEAAAAIARHEESLAIFEELGNNRGIAYALSSLGVAAMEAGDPQRASEVLRESLTLYEELGDRAGMGLALINQGDLARARGDEDRATALYNDALGLHKELGNERGAARALERLSAGPRSGNAKTAWDTPGDG